MLVRLTKFATLAAALVLSAPLAAEAQLAGERHHALSLVGKPQMPPDYKAFDWVNPDAPKGGVLRMYEPGSFDNLNSHTINGDSAEGLSLLSDTLLTTSADEPSAEYGLIAEWVSYPPDYSSVTFGLRKEARFHDGKPITPEDVIFSLDALKKANPQAAQYYKNVVKVEKTGEREVTFTFDSKGNRELPQIVGQLEILPKHFWESRDISKTTTDVPLGSGPYKVKSLDMGRNIVYERVKDYWAKDLPVARGQWNFDEIRFDYYRDRLPGFEAFKTGAVDYWQENLSSAWAHQYDFDAVKKGWVKKLTLPHKRVAGMQGFIFNLRHKQFQDPRVRKALNLAFDFETANRTLAYGQYTRLNSYFDNSELKATGLPQGRELEILNEIKDQVPPEVFTQEFKSPVNTTPEDLRNHMREAMKLLQEAGWTPKNGVLTNAAGEQLALEILLVQPDFEKWTLPYVENLKRLGVKATVRIVDSSQYTRRVKAFEFDIIVDSFGQSHSPGNEQRFFWSSAAADAPGSRNRIGIKNPAIDKLIDRIVFAKDRDELVAATHALDRVLLWNYYLVPNWYRADDWVAVWDMFGMPAKKPSQGVSAIRTWWIDEAKLKALNAARGRS